MIRSKMALILKQYYNLPKDVFVFYSIYVQKFFNFFLNLVAFLLRIPNNILKFLKNTKNNQKSGF
jgi:hypothetical protein